MKKITLSRLRSLIRECINENDEMTKRTPAYFDLLSSSSDGGEWILLVSIDLYGEEKNEEILVPEDVQDGGIPYYEWILQLGKKHNVHYVKDDDNAAEGDEAVEIVTEDGCALVPLTAWVDTMSSELPGGWAAEYKEMGSSLADDWYEQELEKKRNAN